MQSALLGQAWAALDMPQLCYTRGLFQCRGRGSGLVSAAGTVSHAPGKGQPISGVSTPRSAYPGAFSEHKRGWAASRRGASSQLRHQKRVQEGYRPQSVRQVSPPGSR